MPVAPQASAQSGSEDEVMKLSRMTIAATLGIAGTFATACQPSVQADMQGSAQAETKVEPANSQPSQEVAAPKTLQPPGDSPVLRATYDQCISAAGGVTPATLDCIAAEHEYQDGRLNKAYQALIAKLGEDDKAKLRSEQRQWIVDRDARCFYDPESGQAGHLDAAECRLELTASRAAEIESR